MLQRFFDCLSEDRSKARPGSFWIAARLADATSLTTENSLTTETFLTTETLSIIATTLPSLLLLQTRELPSNHG
jgi:hypothetical protein